jgi:hypothetical protein
LIVAELTEADLIWNRACLGDTTALSAGDRALAALLLLHGMVMNGGVLYAVESVTSRQFAAGKSGYRFFGFADVADLLTQAKLLATSNDDLDSIEAQLDRRYQSLVPDDSTLSERFETYLLRSPSDFAPLSVKDRSGT